MQPNQQDPSNIVLSRLAQEIGQLTIGSIQRDVHLEMQGAELAKLKAQLSPKDTPSEAQASPE